MKTKRVQNYIYEGFGFPVELDNIEMVYLEADWHPRIDIQAIADKVVSQLAIQETRLIGHHVKFIRSYYAMSLREFGEKVVHESHMAVSKWEKKGDLITNMNANTEHELRLYIIEKSMAKSKEVTTNFYSHYLATKQFFKAKSDQSSILHIAA